MVDPATGVLVIEKRYSPIALEKERISLNDNGSIVYPSPKRDDWNNDHIEWLTKWADHRIENRRQ